MTDDLVKRLRDDSGTLADLMEAASQAADHIERLEGALLTELLLAATRLDAKDAARQIDSAVKAEVEAITKWLKAHGMRQVANSIERGDYK